MPQPKLAAPSTGLFGPDGSSLPVKGRFSVQSKSLDGELFSHDIYVLRHGGTKLLSRSASLRMGYVRPGVASVSTNGSTTSAQPLGCMSGPPVSIRLQPDAQPYQCPVARRVPFPLVQKVKAELARMVDTRSHLSCHRAYRMVCPNSNCA